MPESDMSNLEVRHLSSRIHDTATKLKNEAATLLGDLIRFRSTPGEEREAIQFLHGITGQLGGRSALVPVPGNITADPDYTFSECDLDYTDRPNLAHVRPGSGGGRSVILQSHVDVVPADPSWAHAFDPVVTEDFVEGRGAADAKGQIATIWLALRILDELGIELSGDVEAQFVIEEEIGGNGALALLAQGHRADAAVIFECTELQIHPANRGVVWYRVRVGGKSVHMGRIREGVSALEEAVKLFPILRRYEGRLIAESQGQPLFAKYEQPVQLNIGTMRAGDWPATVPGEAVFEGGVGFLPNKRRERIKWELRDALESEASGWVRDHYELDFPKLHNDAYETNPKHPAVQAFSASCQELGLEPGISGWNVSCDARLYYHRGGMPTIVFGPGSLSQAHATGERISTEEIVQAAAAAALFLVKWCGASTASR